MAPQKRDEYGAIADVPKAKKAPMPRNSSGLINAPIARPPSGLMKTHGSFHEDLKNFAEGTVPQSIIVALVIGK